jgi:RND family efflux transporter MFP subunit
MLYQKQLNQRTIMLLLCLSACTLSIGCGTASKAKTTKATTPPAAPAARNAAPVVVNVIEARSAQVTGDLLIPSSLAVEQTALVLAQRDGILLQVEASEGQHVTQGQTLARLNDEDERAQLRQAELEVQRLQLEEGQYKALVMVNRNELEREQQLAKEGIASRAQVEHAQYQLDASSGEYEKTRLATKAAQARVEAVKLEIAKSVVNAPRAGVITHRFVSAGTGIVKNDKLFEIEQLEPLTVKFQVPQTGASILSVGQLVNLSLPDGRMIAGARVRRVDPVADATSSTFGYLADVLGGGWKPGLSVNVHVPRTTNGASIWLPRSVFLPDSEPRAGASATLFVVDGDHCAARDVWINSLAGDQVEINSGLAAGERVILDPTNLKAGDAVQVN